MSLTASRRLSVTRYSHDVIDWRDRIIANGGQVSKDTLLVHDRFITALKTANLWDLLIEIGTFAGANLLSALVKLKYPDGGQGALTNHNFVADDYRPFGAMGGLQGAAGKYLAAGTLLSDVGATGSLFFLARSLKSPDVVMLGVEDAGASSGAFLGSDGIVGTFTWGGSIGETPAIVVPTSTALGLIAGLATDDKLTAYRNGVSEATGDIANPPTGATAQALEFFVFARNLNGVATSNFDGLGSFYALGTADFTAAQMTKLWGAVQQLQAGLLRTGNSVPVGDSPGQNLGDANQTLAQI